MVQSVEIPRQRRLRPLHDLLYSGVPHQTHTSKFMASASLESWSDAARPAHLACLWMKTAPLGSPPPRGPSTSVRMLAFSRVDRTGGDRDAPGDVLLQIRKCLMEKKRTLADGIICLEIHNGQP